MSQPQTESYTAAKGGISALTHALAVSLAGRVRVNSISPGWIDTDFTEYTGADAPLYFDNVYEDEWIEDSFVKEMIQDVVTEDSNSGYHLDAR